MKVGLDCDDHDGDADASRAQDQRQLPAHLVAYEASSADGPIHVDVLENRVVS